MQMLRITSYPAGGTMAPHSHEEASLTVVLSGGYLERIRGAEMEHRPGRILFYPARATHSQRFGATGARKIVLTPGQSSITYLREHGVSLDSARFVDAPVISQLAHHAAAEVETGDPFTPLALEGIAMELVAAFARADQPTSRAAAPLWVRAARDAICDGQDERLSLDEIAARIGKHPVHLAREFRRYYGATIGTYRRQLRLQRAEGMLRKDVGLTEVALACGFASHSHFCRTFKAAYGMSPSKFRVQSSGAAQKKMA